MLVVTYLSLFVLSLLCAAAYWTLRIAKPDSTQNPTFLAFQKKYIPVYLLVVLGDWLQGNNSCAEAITVPVNDIVLFV